MTKTEAYFIVATFPVIFLVVFVMPLWAALLRWFPRYRMRVKCLIVEWYSAVQRAAKKLADDQQQADNSKNDKR